MIAAMTAVPTPRARLAATAARQQRRAESGRPLAPR